MLLLALGGTGIGLVWGWLAGRFLQDEPPLLRTILALLLSTLAIVALVWWMSSWKGAVFFSGATVISFLFHVAWREGLRKQFESGNSK